MSEPLKWSTFAAFAATVEGETLTLMLYISELPGAWGVTALEAPRTTTHPKQPRRRRGERAPSAADRAMKMAQGVLDQHAHEIVGRAESIADAFQLADTYAQAWRARQAPQPLCGCGEIAS